MATPVRFDHMTNDGDHFQVPEGWTPDPRSSHCRSCRALIVWCLTPRGKRAPVEPNGDSHFSTCPDRDTWRKPR